jgi:dephospho-CoA kinase
MIKIGLTGGIASGKTLVAKMFSELGIEIIDADEIARDVVEAGEPAYKAILKHFGPSVVDQKGHLQRHVLRKIVFEQEDERLWLESLLHPLIVAEMEKRLAKIDADYCIIVIPLLVENTQARSLVDRILVVDTHEAMQLRRVMQRDQIDLEAAKKILNAQASRAERLSLADDVLINETDLIDLKEKVFDLHKYYTAIAHSSSSF